MPPKNRFERPERTQDEKEKLALQREQKRVIWGMLTDGKNIIEKNWRKAQGTSAKTFTLSTEDLALDGLLSRDDIATLIRRWVFDTYGDKLGLDYYNEVERTITFSFSPEEFPPSKE